MELANELVDQIEKEYIEWCDDCEEQGLFVFCSPEEVFKFIKHFIDKETNK